MALKKVRKEDDFIRKLILKTNLIKEEFENLTMIPKIGILFEEFI